MKEMKIEYRNIDEIKPYENNPRNNDDAVDFVANSIKEFGFKVPIIVDENDVIVTGHTRLKAAKKLNLKKVPVIKADDLTEEQIKAFRIADNKVSEYSTWDLSKLDLELEDIDLDMSNFGLLEAEKIDWDNVDNLSDETYDEPTHNMLECPKCHHIDRDIHFQKVEKIYSDENSDI